MPLVRLNPDFVLSSVLHCAVENHMAVLPAWPGRSGLLMLALWCATAAFLSGLGELELARGPVSALPRSSQLLRACPTSSVIAS